MKTILQLLLLVSLTSLLAGCGGIRTPTKDSQTMGEIYERHFLESENSNGLRRLPVYKDLSATRKREETELADEFELLDNPMLLIYVYPHIATDDRMPVPGYWTAIPLYERDEFALPGESHRVEIFD